GWAEARRLPERALAIRLKVHVPDGAHVAYSRTALGWLFMAKGDPAAAVEHFRAAVQIREKALGPAHRLTLSSRGDLAAALAGVGRCAEAEPLLASALPGVEKVDGPEHPDLVLMLATKGRCEVAAGRAQDGVKRIARAVAIGEKMKIPVADLGSARWRLALALWAAGERAEAIASARQAERELATDGDGAVEREGARAWIARVAGNR